MQIITSATRLPLHDVASTRAIEAWAAAGLPPHTLMQRAGLAVARLALALAPHARHIWVACGPGNNGGDGFEAALQLHLLGKKVTVTRTGGEAGSRALPPDAQASMDRALAAGVCFAGAAPGDADFCIDALLGIGGSSVAARPGSQQLQQTLSLLRQARVPVLAIDVPTGLNADTGVDSARAAFGSEAIAMNSIAGGAGADCAAARFTLSLLTLKPGLFTAAGRDLAGQVWLDDLGTGAAHGIAATALLQGADAAGETPRHAFRHDSHKGNFGDVAVLGGESQAHGSMAGAALLAARAALHGGAGRVMVALLGNAALAIDTTQPELMFRSPDALDVRQPVVVCGCGGGEAVKAWLPKVLSNAIRLVLDADALNAVAGDTGLQTLLASRSGRGHGTVLTPHPLEAARLLACTAAQVQADRLSAAQTLANGFNCVVVLKGSGTVIAAPGQLPRINPTGNALLATAGTGDVLAGLVGALLAGGATAMEAACSAVWRHGRTADDWARERPGQPFTASALAESI
jgi:ADP-dependent NAD(P)H-hydrate dehydratase / NAD(P)H-hydrate epimerase